LRLKISKGTTSVGDTTLGPELKQFEDILDYPLFIQHYNYYVFQASFQCKQV